MAEIKDLSGTDANNTGTAANAGFPENMAYSDVNNAARALEGMIARHFADSNGTLTTTGSSNAYLLTPNRTVSAYTAGDAYMIKASFTNTGAVTVNVSSLGAKSIVKPSGDALAAGELTSGGIYAIIYDGTNFQMAGADDPENLTLTSLTVTGTTALNGNTTIGDAASDTVTITADVASDLIPSADGTHDLGAVGSEWQDLFVDGIASIDSLVADTADIDSGTIDGTVIGGNSAAAITGTTVVANTSVNIAGDGATVTGIKDEDNMASDSATKLATQQSIKAYVDNQITAQDLDVTDGTTSIDIDLDSESLGILGGTGIDSSASGTGVSLSIDSTVATLTDSQTLTNKTLTSPVLNTGVSGTAILDEDNMASNSATQLATQQSIKTYVDNQLTAEDLDFQADSGGALSVDLDSQTFTLTGGTGIDTVGANQTVTFAIDSTVTTLTGTQTLTNKTLTSPVLDTSVSGTAVLDEDNMASDSATKLATQQSIKAYVDSQVTAQDLDVTDGTTSIDIDLDSESLGILGGTGIDSTASGTGVSLAIDSTVTTLTGTQTLTNKSLTAPTLTGTAVVASLDISGDIDVDGITNLDVVDIDGGVDMASTLAVGGVSTLTGGSTMPDNAMAKFGTGDDFEIYFNGTHGVIKTATGVGGNVYIQDDNNIVLGSIGGETYINAAKDGAVTLYHDNAAKLATTSTGIDVTGSVTADGLTVNGGGSNIATTFKSTDATVGIKLEDDTGNVELSALGNVFSVQPAGGSPILTASSTGVGIGTSSPSTYDSRANNLVVGDSGDAGITIFSGSTSNARLQFAPSGDTGLNNGLIDYDNNNDSMAFATGGSERMRIDASGDVGIGCSPDFPLHVSSTGVVLGLNATSGAVSQRFNENGTARFFLSTLNGSNGLAFVNGDGVSERMRIDSSGVVLAGKTSANNGTVGVEASAAALNATVSGDTVSRLNRLSTDGEILRFQKDTATVGSIATTSSRLSIGSNDVGLFFDSTNERLTPIHQTNQTDRDAAISLGYGSSRFKSLYLSGGVIANDHLTIQTDDAELYFSNTANNNYYRIRRTGASGDLAFDHYNGTSTSEAMRINSSGNLLCGHTNSDTTRVSVEAVSNGSVMQFRRNTATYGSSAIVGSITADSVSTVYATSSDQRLKDNIKDADDAGELIDAIQVRQFDWIEDGEHQRYGMVAQELTTVAPEAVYTPEDPDEMMGVDYSKLVPMLIKEIQTLRSRVAQLEQ